MSEIKICQIGVMKGKITVKDGVIIRAPMWAFRYIGENINTLPPYVKVKDVPGSVLERLFDKTEAWVLGR